MNWGLSRFHVGRGRSAGMAFMVCGALLAAWADRGTQAQEVVALRMAQWLQEPAVAQVDGHPLTLQELMAAVEDTHPALLASRLQARAAQEDVSAVERQRWPSLAVVLESAAGSAGVEPSRQFRLEQTLWDFGRVGHLVGESQAQVAVSQTQITIVRQELLLKLIGAWQQLLAGLERERVALRAKRLLDGYREQMQRRVDARASAPIDLELVEARVLQVNADIAAARSVVQQATSSLEQISGLRNLAQRAKGARPTRWVERVDSLAQPLLSLDLAFVSSEHPAVVRARQEYSVLERRLEVKQAELKPQVYFRLDKPLDRGAGLVSTSPRYFVGLRYTPAAGLAGHAEAKALSTRLEGQAQASDTARREVLRSLQADRVEFLSARARIEGLERSVESAEEVLASYQRQFQAARKSWQDLLNTVRDLSNSEYALADARITMLAALYRLHVRASLPTEQL